MKTFSKGTKGVVVVIAGYFGLKKCKRLKFEFGFMGLKSWKDFNLAGLLEMAWEYNLNILPSISKIKFQVKIFADF